MARLLLEDLERRIVLSTPSVRLNLEIARPPGFHVEGTILTPTGDIVPLVGGSSSPVGLTPDQIRTAYGINNIAIGGVTGDGTGQTIAIVDAYDEPAFPNSTSPNFGSGDLAQFDQAFGLPNPPSFTKYNQAGATGPLPGTDPAGQGNPLGNWELEEALDVEWAHAVAPKAKIDLVEANAATNADLFAAVATAANLPGVSAVSMSWGLYEVSKETSFDGTFATPSGHPGVTFLAATGDSGSPGTYPAFAPNVVAVGGTTLNLNGNTWGSEDGWSGSGGGTSEFEPEPSYQSGVQSTGQRTIPDVAFDADPDTGVAVYDSWNDTDASGPWIQIGGTSLAAPAWAGLIAIANQGRGGAPLDGASQTLPALYRLSSTDFHDITSGDNGDFAAGPGYDEVTGLGTPKANLLIPALAAYGTTTKMAITAQPPSSIIAGDSFGIVVTAEDGAGDVATTFHGTVTLALGNNPGGATLGGTTTVTAVNGVAVFDGLTLNKPGSGYTLKLSSAGFSTLTTSSFAVTSNPTPWAGTYYPVPTDASLRKAISQAESNGYANNFIMLEAADYTLTDAKAGQLLIQNTSSLANKTLTIVGQGSSSTIIGGSPGWNDRVIAVVGASTTVVLQKLAIEHGRAQGGGILGGTAALGGGVLVDGASVAMTNVAVASNQAAGLSGALGRTGAHAAAGGPGGKGDDAQGGGLYLASGTLTLNNVTLSNNIARGGGGGTGGHGGSGVVPAHPTQQQPGGAGGTGGTGGTAAGGGIYVAGGQLTLSGVTFSQDEAIGGIGGTGGTGGMGGANNPGGAGGAGGAAGPAAGGAIFLARGTINLTATTLHGDTAVGGIGGLGGVGGSGGSAFVSATGTSGLLGSGTGETGVTVPPVGTGADGGPGGAGGLGAAGRGGGVYVAGGTLTLATMTLSDDLAAGGQGGMGGHGGHGEVGSLGGLLSGTIFGGVTGGRGGNGGDAGDGQGGGLYVSGGAVTLLDGTLNANLALGGRGGDGGTGGSGALAGGLSGLYRDAGVPHGGITRLTTGSSFTLPTGPAARTGGNGGDGGDGGIGWGGGLYVGGGTITLLNTTVAANNAQGGSGGSAGPGGPGGSFSLGKGFSGSSGSTGSTSAGDLTIVGSVAAGLYVAGGAVTLDNSTVALNALIPTVYGTTGTGDGVVQVAGTVTANSTLFAANGTDNYIGNVTASHSLFQTAPTHGTVSGSANLIGANPLLAAAGLANNGGPTQTIALQTGSPALGKGSNPEGLLTDQRGFAPRTSGSSGTDIGAYQAGATADKTAPTVTLNAASVAGADAGSLNPYTFTLTFKDNVAVAAASLPGARVQVIAPDGTPLAATVVGSTKSGASDAPGDAASVVITYQITPPGGSWTPADDGTYTVKLGGAPVYDLAGNAVASGTIGTFNVQSGSTIWSGKGSTSNWSDPQNWSGGVAPTAGSDLVFGPSAAKFTSTDDLPAGTRFGTITFTGGGYNIGGNGIVLTVGLDASNATGSNSFSPAITLSTAETFLVGSGATVLTVGGKLNTGGHILTVGGGGGQLHLTNVISGGGGLVIANSGTTVLSGSGNTFTGATNAQSGTLVLQCASGNAIPGSLTIGAATVRLNAGNQIADTAAVTLNGAGLLNTNSYSDKIAALSLSGSSVTTGAGTLTVTGNVTDSGTSTISGKLALGGTSQTFQVNSGSTLTVTASISGGGGLKKSGAGTLVLSGSNTYTGGTTLLTGLLTATKGTSLGGGVLTLQGGTLSVGNALTLSNAVTLAGNASIGGSYALTFSGPVTLTGNRTLSITDTGGATVAGAVGQAGGAWKLIKGGASTLTLQGNNTYTGGTTLAGGTLVLGRNTAAGGGVLTLQGGTLDSGGGARSLANAVTLAGNVTIGGSYALTFSGPVTLTGNRTLTVSDTGGVTIAGAIGQSTGGIGLTKAGSGTLVLSASDTYTGATTVSAGTLLVNGSITSTVTVDSGATLGGSGTTAAVKVLSGGVLLPGRSGQPGILSTGGVNFTAGANFNVTLNGSSPGLAGYAQLHVSGAVSLNGSKLNVSMGYPAAVGTSFTLIKNSGTNAVSGTFSNLAEGATFVVGSMTFRITYKGGASGKDVVITRVA